MRKIYAFLISCFLVSAISGCIWTQPEPKVSDIVAMVKHKNDPYNKRGTFKSAVSRYKCRNDNEESYLTIVSKRPGMAKIMYRMKDEFWECGFNGKKAWQYDNRSGMRELTEAQTNEIRLQAYLLVPSINIEKVFKEILLLGSEDLNGRACWKLKCQPRDEFKSQPIIVYVNKEDKTIVKLIEKQDTKDAFINVVTIFSKYKMYKYFYLPSEIVTKVDDDVTESKLLTVQLNLDIPDSAFTPPQSFK